MTKPTVTVHKAQATPTRPSIMKRSHTVEIEDITDSFASEVSGGPASIVTGLMTPADTSQASSVHGGMAATEESTPPSTAPSVNGASTPKDDGTGLARLGRGVKALVESVNNLRHLGVEDLVLPLPKIVVVGDQSTGKSSLIEAISEIKVPKKAGTCTRCPLEITTTEDSSPDATWSCKVSLFKKYMYAPSDESGRSRKRAVSKDRPFGPFTTLQPPENLLFKTIYDKRQVIKTIFWAQLATLNPHEDHRSYVAKLNRDLENSNSWEPEDDTSCPLKVAFSPNVVRLDIAGPGLPNLSFYDLPGLINQNDDEDHLVSMVRNLVKDYIRDKNSLVLLTVPMTGDAATSSAGGLVKDMDAKGRCIGVLTKPDRLEIGNTWAQWIEILQNHLYPVGYGYFVTKQPSQSSLDARIDHVQARQEEIDFFEDNPPWSTKFQDFSKRFGTSNLQTFLSEKLTAQILNNLPNIEEKVRQKAEAIEMELSQIPQPPKENIPMMLSGKLYDFSRLFHKHVDGEYHTAQFEKEWLKIAAQFREIMENSLPKLILPCKADTPRQPVRCTASTPSSRTAMASTPSRSGVRAPTIDLLDSDDENVSKTEPGSHQSGAGQRDSRTKRRLFEDSRSSPAFRGQPSVGRHFTLSEVRDASQDGCAVGIPGPAHPKAIVHLYKQSVEHWRAETENFVATSGSLLRRQVLESLDEVFESYKQTPLAVEVPRIANAFVDDIIKRQSEAAAEAFQLEIYKPLTMDGQRHMELKEAAWDYFKARRQEHRARLELLQQERQHGRASEGPARQKEQEKIAQKLGADPFSKEIETLATVRAYYNMSMARFVDTMCLKIQGEMFLLAKKNVEVELRNNLGIMQPNADVLCATLLGEDPARMERRSRLTHEKQRLEQAQALLDALRSS
ncbi:MAG: hypothetical protein M1833_006371 [Piccolia ochrophora]|nr:MAG: hypothetical protein M1833_006371 [Piccolia ochrophora]